MNNYSEQRRQEIVFIFIGRWETIKTNFYCYLKTLFPLFSLPLLCLYCWNGWDMKKFAYYFIFIFNEWRKVIYSSNNQHAVIINLIQCNVPSPKSIVVITHYIRFCVTIKITYTSFDSFNSRLYDSRKSISFIWLLSFKPHWSIKLTYINLTLTYNKVSIQYKKNGEFLLNKICVSLHSKQKSSG